MRIVTIWTIVYGITAVIQGYFFIALLDVQDSGVLHSPLSLSLSLDVTKMKILSAYRSQDRLYGFRKGQQFTYFLEGWISLTIMGAYYTCFILEYHYHWSPQSDHRYIIFRGGGMLLFNVLQLVMLIPIRAIGASPKFKDYFRRSRNRKYLRIFRWMCFLNVCNIAYSVLFICDTFGNALTEYEIQNSTAMRGAYALCFGSIYFSVWALSRLLPWVIPNEFASKALYTYNPAVNVEHQSDLSYLTQYARVDASKLGINSSLSPVPTDLTIDYKLNDDDKHNRKRKEFKERDTNPINEEFVADENVFYVEKYDDVIKMFQNQMENDVDNDHLEKIEANQEHNDSEEPQLIRKSGDYTM